MFRVNVAKKKNKMKIMAIFEEKFWETNGELNCFGRGCYM